jgi:hypothetical protein
MIGRNFGERCAIASAGSAGFGLQVSSMAKIGQGVLSGGCDEHNIAAFTAIAAGGAAAVDVFFLTPGDHTVAAFSRDDLDFYFVDETHGRTSLSLQ